MTDIEFNHWFPTTIGASYYPNHLKEKDELIKYCYEIKSKTKRGGEGWVSSETYNTSDGQLDINHDEKFMGISNFVVESVKSYLDQVNLKMKLELIDGWLNIYNKNNYQETHRHNTYVMSCIYFLKAPEKSAGTIFYSPHKEMVISDELYNNPNYRPSGYLTYRAVEGKLLMFRSHVEHAVELHKNDEDRITLAYNFKEAT